MIPVIMLAINIGALSSLFLTFFYLIMTCPSFEYTPVIYLWMVAMAIICALELQRVDENDFLNRMLTGIQITNLSLSLLINISATSIIGFKTWCVRVDSENVSLTVP
jgi:hypothetical protein